MPATSMAGCCCTQPIDQIRQVMDVNVIGADPGDPGLHPLMAATASSAAQPWPPLSISALRWPASSADRSWAPMSASKHAIGGLSEIQHGLAELPRTPDRRRVVSVAKGKRLRTLIVRFRLAFRPVAVLAH
jgi:hypothetical protein